MTDRCGNVLPEGDGMGTVSSIGKPPQNVPQSVGENSAAHELYADVPLYGFHGVKPLSYEIPHQHEKDRREKERDARDAQRLAVEKKTFWVGFAGLVFLLFTLFETIEATKAATKQARIAEEHLVLSERPWVSVNIATAEPLVFSANGAKTEIRFTLKNLGHSPAMYARLHYDTLSIFGNLKEAEIKQQEICSHIRGLPNSAGIGDTILPEGQLVQQRGFRVGKDEIDKNTHVSPERSMISLAVVGCVDYQFVFAKGHHQIGFVFLLNRRDQEHPNGGIAIDPTAGTIPAEQIGFFSYGGVIVD